MKQYQIFISHAGEDEWIAQQISNKLKRKGASTYLDSERMLAGANFNDEILAQLRKSKELVALLTKSAIEKKYVWIEIGGMLTMNRRVVGLLQGLTIDDIQKHTMNLSMLTDKHLLHLNDVEKYFKQLKERIDGIRMP